MTTSVQPILPTSLMLPNKTLATLMIHPMNEVNTTPSLSPSAQCQLRAQTTGVIIHAVFLTLIMAASLLGNFVVVLAVAMSKPLKKRVTFYFIVSLACSDFFLAMFLLPFKISTKLNGDYFCHHIAACYFYIISDAFGNVASILNLLLIALDRFIAIKFPFRYCEIVSPANSKKAIVFVWILSGIWSFIGIFNWRVSSEIFSINIGPICYNSNKDYYAASSFGIYITVLVVITCTYITILHVACSQIQAIEANQPTLPSNKFLLPNNRYSNTSTETSRRRSKRTLHKELRATKSVAIVYLAYVVCWLPCYVINIIIYVDINYFPRLKAVDPNLFLFLYYAFIEVLPSVNHCVNPFIYSFSNRQFRTAVKASVSKLFRLETDINKHIHSSFLESNSNHASPSVSRLGTPRKDRDERS